MASRAPGPFVAGEAATRATGSSAGHSSHMPACRAARSTTRSPDGRPGSGRSTTSWSGIWRCGGRFISQRRDRVFLTGDRKIREVRPMVCIVRLWPFGPGPFRTRVSRPGGAAVGRPRLLLRRSREVDDSVRDLLTEAYLASAD